MGGLDGYMGCFMRDEIPDDVPARHGFILNLDTSNGGGTHWTAVMRVSPASNKPLHMCYYDSFGCPPPEEVLDRYGSCYYNTEIHQPIRSSACGWYAMYILEETIGGGVPFLNVAYSLEPGGDANGSYTDPARDIGSPDNDIIVSRSVHSSSS